jgi:hypothetical protein
MRRDSRPYAPCQAVVVRRLYEIILQTQRANVGRKERD